MVNSVLAFVISSFLSLVKSNRSLIAKSSLVGYCVYCYGSE